MGTSNVLHIQYVNVFVWEMYIIFHDFKNDCAKCGASVGCVEFCSGRLMYRHIDCTEQFMHSRENEQTHELSLV